MGGRGGPPYAAMGPAGATEGRESNGCAQAKQAPSLDASRRQCPPGGSMSPDSLTSPNVLRLPLSLFLWLRPASRFDRHFQTHRTRLGRPFIAYQLSTRGPHIVTSYVWAGVVSTDQIRSLQVFPVHTPVRRGQSGTLSGGHVVPGQVRRALPLDVHSPRACKRNPKELPTIQMLILGS